MAQDQGATARVFRRDRLIAACCLALAALLSWAWLLAEAGRMAEGTMASMPGMPMPGPPAGTLAYFTAASLMWLLMMTAMMLPSASPMILLYARVTGRMRADGASLAPTFVFAGVYLALWSLFAMAAGGLQAALVHWGVLHAGLLSLRAQAAAGILLLLAGAYQFTSAKQACLDRCRAPLSLLVNWWRPGWAGAARLGLVHGLYCIGCCWALMALLFVGGVMNLGWVVALAVLVAVEKLAPFSRAATLASGIVATATGVGLLILALIARP